MSIEEQNTIILTKFFGHFFAGRREEAFALMAPGAKWVIPGRSALAGTHDARAFAGQLLDLVDRRMPKGMTFEVKSVTAQGPRVALELEARGEIDNGTVYNNQYHFLCTLNDGLVEEWKEYMCTAHTIDVILPLLSQA